MDAKTYRKREQTERLLSIRTTDGAYHNAECENRTAAVKLAEFLVKQPQVRTVSLWTVGMTTVESLMDWHNAGAAS